MKIARILYPVTVLGPGKRIAIWVAGCSKRCKGCANPELWDKAKYPELSIEALRQSLELIYEKAGGNVDGITISGGEPFEQPEELLSLVLYLKERTQDILIFSGRSKEELEKEKTNTSVLQEIAVLIDGEYREEENHGEILRGSVNQKIHILREEFEERYAVYQQEYQGMHPVESFTVNDGVIAVGIHKKDFNEKLAEQLETKGIIRKTGV